jgi:phosphate uptake regulator
MDLRGQDFDQVRAQLRAMSSLVHVAIGQAATSLLELDDAQRVASRALRELRRELDDLASLIVSRGQEPGTDLRPILAGVHASAEVEGMAEAARDLLLIARSRQGKVPLPTELKAILRRMSDVTLAIVTAAQEVSGSLEGAKKGQELGRSRAEMERLQRHLYQVLSVATNCSVRTVIDVTLAARALERCANHALSLGRHLTLFANATPAT